MGKCDFISSAESSGLCLDGLAFPATKQQIIDWIEDNGGAESAIVAANQLPDRTFSSLDELEAEVEK